MKYIKYLLLALVIVFALNYFHVINFDLSNKTKEASNMLIEKAKTELNKIPLAKSVDKDIIKYVIDKGMPAKFSVKGNGVYAIKGSSLTGTFYSKTPRYVEISFNPTDTAAIRQAEGVITLFTGEEFEFVPENIKDLTTVKVRINKEGNKFKIKSNLPVELEV